MEKYKISYLSDLSTECTHSSGAVIRTDAPKDNQGKGELFSPTDLLAVSLGSCMLTMMAISARQWKVDLKGTIVDVQKEMSVDSPRRIIRLIVRFRCPVHVSTDVQKKLEEAAIHCPVHASLHPDIKQEIEFNWGF